MNNEDINQLILKIDTERRIIINNQEYDVISRDDVEFDDNDDWITKFSLQTQNGETKILSFYFRDHEEIFFDGVFLDDTQITESDIQF